MGNEKTSATDLCGAYEVIDKAQSETQIKAIIGTQSDKRQPDGEAALILTWEADIGTY